MVQFRLVKLMPQLEGSIMGEAKFMAANYLSALSRYEFAARFVKNKNVLEVGCGAGYGAAILAGKARRVVAIDYSRQSISQAKENFSAKNLSFRLGDVNKLPFPANSFDLIVAFEVIEHLENPQRALAEMKRVLKPGGRLIFSTPNKTLYSPDTKKAFYPYHFREYTAGDLKKIFIDFGRVEFYGQYIKNKNELVYQPWDPRRLIRIIFANLPLEIKKMIMTSYLGIADLLYQIKIYRPKEIKESDIVFKKSINKTRTLIGLVKKAHV